MCAGETGVAVGGYEERIQVMHWSRPDKADEEGFILEEHMGTITALRFHQSSYLVSAAEDSQICVWKMKPHVLYHTFKYKSPAGACIDLAIHPSGKILLSLHKDGYLLFWNMITGHHEFQKKIEPAIFRLGFLGAAGNVFFMASLTGVNIHTVSSDEPITKLSPAESADKLLTVAGADDFVVAGTQNRNLMVWKISAEGKLLGTAIKGGLWTGKVKDLGVCVCPGKQKGIFVALITSEAELVVLDLGEDVAAEGKVDWSPKVVLKTKMESRSICLAVANSMIPGAIHVEKEKKNEPSKKAKAEEAKTA